MYLSLLPNILEILHPRTLFLISPLYVTPCFELCIFFINCYSFRLDYPLSHWLYVCHKRNNSKWRRTVIAVTILNIYPFIPTTVPCQHGFTSNLIGFEGVFLHFKHSISTIYHKSMYVNWNHFRYKSMSL